MRGREIIPHAWQKSTVDEMWPFKRPDPQRPDSDRYRSTRWTRAKPFAGY